MIFQPSLQKVAFASAWCRAAVSCLRAPCICLTICVSVVRHFAQARGRNGGGSEPMNGCSTRTEGLLGTGFHAPKLGRWWRTWETTRPLSCSCPGPPSHSTAELLTNGWFLIV